MTASPGAVWNIFEGTFERGLDGLAEFLSRTFRVGSSLATAAAASSIGSFLHLRPESHYGLQTLLSLL